MTKTAHSLQNTNMEGAACLRASGVRSERPQPRRFAGLPGRVPGQLCGTEPERPGFEGRERKRAGNPWHTTGQGPRTNVSEPLATHKLRRGNNLQNSTQNRAPVRGGQALVHPAGQASRYLLNPNSHLAIVIARSTTQEVSVLRCLVRPLR